MTPCACGPIGCWSAGCRIQSELTAVALANKLARIVFALLTRGGVYAGQPVSA